MATGHPYSEHREHGKSHSRVHHILKSHPDGATKHQTGHAFSAVKSKGGAASHDHKVTGKKAPKRYARGGKVKGEKHTTNVIVAVPHHRPNPPVPPMGPQAGPPVPPMGGPAPPPPGMGPGMGPPGMPPMRARGGKVDISGEATPQTLDKWSKRAADNSIGSKVGYKHSYARGGALPTAGAMSGVGRIQEAKLVARKQGHKGAK